MTGEGIKKKRDPIFSVCFVVFIVACVAVLGVYINDHYLEKDDTKVAFGDTVTVNYVGSYYAYYGEDGAVVFDTSYSDVGKDDSIVKSDDFSKSSYSTFKVTVGSNGALNLFENALVGHKVGDKDIKVYIPADEAYGTFPGTAVHSGVSTTFDVPVVQKMSTSTFKSLYDVTPTANTQVVITSTYGWQASAVLDNADNMVVITNMPVSGEKYEYIGNEDSEFGKATFTVNGITDGAITVTLGLTETKKVEGSEIQMLKLNLDGKPIYITNYDGNTMTYKTTGGKEGMDLFFVIEIVSITPVSENTSTTITG